MVLPRLARNVTLRPSAVQRGRNSGTLSNERRESGPRGSCLIQMSSPPPVLSPIATRLPSGDSDHPMFAPLNVRRTVHPESTTVSRPARSTQTSMCVPWAATEPPERLTIVPSSASANMGPSARTVTLSSTGTASPFTVNEARSNGAASMAPSCRTYRICPVGAYQPRTAPVNRRLDAPDLKSTTQRSSSTPQLAPEHRVNSTPRDCGRAAGDAAISERSDCQTTDAEPPLALSRISCLAPRRTKTMLPSSSQARPREGATLSAIAIPAPPTRGVLRSVVP